MIHRSDFDILRSGSGCMSKEVLHPAFVMVSKAGKFLLLSFFNIIQSDSELDSGNPHLTNQRSQTTNSYHQRNNHNDSFQLHGFLDKVSN